MHKQEFCKNGHEMSKTRIKLPNGSTACNQCRLEYGRQYRKEYDKNNKDKVKQRKTEYRKKNQKKINQQSLVRKRLLKQKWLDLFEQSGRLHCRRCGYRTCISALDFHHKNKKDKQNLISDFTIRGLLITVGRLEELSKTITLCKNCHAELHAGVWKLEELNNV